MKQPDRNPETCRLFVLRAKEFLSDHPNISHSWSIDEDEDHCILDIPARSETGFDITIEVFPGRIDILAEGYHHHLDYLENADTTVMAALKFMHNMLSTRLRVVEYTRNGKPYKWQLQSCEQGKWITVETTCLLFFNFFGKKGSHVYQNDVLPG